MCYSHTKQKRLPSPSNLGVHLGLYRHVDEGRGGSGDYLIHSSRWCPSRWNAILQVHSSLLLFPPPPSSYESNLAVGTCGESWCLARVFIPVGLLVVCHGASVQEMFAKWMNKWTRKGFPILSLQQSKVRPVNIDSVFSLLPWKAEAAGTAEAPHLLEDTSRGCGVLECLHTAFNFCKNHHLPIAWFRILDPEGP